MKLKSLKRILSVLLTGLISLNAISFVTFAEETNDSSHFTYTVADGVATIATFDNTITDVTLPDSVVIDGITYNSENEKLVIGKSLFRTTKSQTYSVENVVIPKGYKTLPQYIFRETTSLKIVTCKYTGDDFKLNSYGFYKCTSLEKLYIYANTLNQSTILNTFNDVPTTATAFVKNEAVKSSLETANWPGTIIIDPSLGNETPIVNKTALSEKITEVETFLAGIDKTQYNNVEELETKLTSARAVYENASATQTEVDNEVIALASALNKVTKIKQASSFTITKCESINYGTEGGFKPQVNITAGDGEITYKLFSDEACTRESGHNYNSSLISPNSYYIKGFMAETENYYASESNAVKVQVYRIGVSKKALNEAITAAETFFEENESRKVDFNSAAWNDVYDDTRGKLARAKSMAQNDSGTVFQSEVDERTQELITSLNTLKVSPADTTEIRAELENVINTAEAIENVYSEKSWQAFQTALNTAKEAFAKENEFKSVYSEAKDTLFRAIENLTTEEAGDPFILIQKGAKEEVLADLKADEAINGAAKIKVTFDCAEDVNFNKYASIELKAIIAGTESYAKIVGTVPQDEAVNGEKGIVVELPLTNPIATGDDVRLTAYTWAWNGAKEHVYGITKVEFFDAYGHAMYAITDRTIAYDDLQTEIAEAEKIEQGNYSDESFAELAKAIESAKALPDNASKSDIDKAIQDIDNAIKGLKELTPTEPVTPPTPTKPDPTQPEPSNNSQPTKPSIAPTKPIRDLKVAAKEKQAAVKAMKQAKITKLTVKSKAKKKITVTWKKVKKAVGYEVQISAKKNFKKPIADKHTSKKKLTIKSKKLKSGKKYYVRVRAYATYKDKNNVTQKVYSKWNKKIRTVKVK